jgi:hypothetical protein
VPRAFEYIGYSDAMQKHVVRERCAGGDRLHEFETKPAADFFIETDGRVKPRKLSDFEKRLLSALSQAMTDTRPMHIRDAIKPADHWRANAARIFAELENRA